MVVVETGWWRRVVVFDGGRLLVAMAGEDAVKSPCCTVFRGMLQPLPGPGGAHVQTLARLLACTSGPGLRMAAMAHNAPRGGVTTLT